MPSSTLKAKRYSANMSPTMLTTHAPWPPVPNNSVLYLPGEPGSGATITDISGQGNHGTITGATWERLPSGLWYLDFDGDVVDVGAKLIAEDATFSAELWFKPNSDHYGGLISEDDAGTGRDWALAQFTGETLRIRIYPTGATYDKASVFTTGVWTHVGIFRDHANSKVYWIVNGVLFDTGGAEPNLNYSATTTLKIGQMYTSGYRCNGGIDLTVVRLGSMTLAQATSNAEYKYNQERHLFGV